MVTKGEIACFERFVFCLHVFKKLSAAVASKVSIIMRKGLNLKTIDYMSFNPFQETTNLQQITLTTSWHKCEKSQFMKDYGLMNLKTL